MSAEMITYEIEGDIALIGLNRPDKRNAMNDEMRRRSDDLNEVNEFLESILTSLRGAVVALDRDQRVLAWNHG